MIKINLIGDEEVTSADSIIWLVAYVASIILSIVLLLVVRSIVVTALADYDQRVARGEAQLAALREKTKAVDGLKATREQVQGMTLAIASLRKAQEGPVKLLDELNLAVPENVWITSVDSKSNIMKIEGLSLDDLSITQFIQRFRESDLVVESDLKDRRSASLVQVNTFNSFTGDQTKAVIKGDKSAVGTKLAEIQREAEQLGLLYSYGVPESSLKDSVDQSNKSSGAVTKLSFESAGKRRFIGGRPTIFAWESLE